MKGYFWFKKRASIPLAPCIERADTDPDQQNYHDCDRIRIQNTKITTKLWYSIGRRYKYWVQHTPPIISAATSLSMAGGGS